MRQIGIDVGSTYTKYCIMKDHSIEQLFSEKTPIRQKEYFEKKLQELRADYPDAEIISCGYGKNNVPGTKAINELTALARGAEYMVPGAELVLDIGGQDTKIIRQENGQLKEFFINDKCAAGSGMFLTNVCAMLDSSFRGIRLIPYEEMDIRISSVCAVFAQSEIVELIAANVNEQAIISAVVYQILTQAKPLVSKVKNGPLVLSGGLTKIPGIEEYAGRILDRECRVIPNAEYLAATGCAGDDL